MVQENSQEGGVRCMPRQQNWGCKWGGWQICSVRFAKKTRSV